MPINEAAIARLQTLRNRIQNLVQQAEAGPEFRAWLRSTFSAIEEIFGPDSQELKDFAGIRFELDPSLMDNLTDRFRQVLEAQVSGDAIRKLRVSQDAYFKERLRQADEVLLGCIIKIKLKEN